MAGVVAGGFDQVREMQRRIDDGMIRVSCGVESADLLVADFLRALDLTG